MRKNHFYFMVLVAAAIGSGLSHADTSITTVPEGMLTFNLTQGKMSYLSLPLTSHPTYSGVVTAVTANRVLVDDAKAPSFANSLDTAAAPYFVKFLTGSEAGRVMLITGNTSSQLTLDITDHVTGSAVALNAEGFTVKVGDAFEIFSGDTLASVFGAGTDDAPLLLTGAKDVTNSDAVSILAGGATASVYYFNTSASQWEKVGSTDSANNTIIYPYSAFAVNRRANHPDTTLVLQGRVAQVASATKVVGQGTVYAANTYATDIKLSQVQFGRNWQTGTSAVTADTISIWNASTSKFDTFYQKPDSTWRSNTDSTTDQGNYVIAAGTVTTIEKRQSASGSATFLESSMPYSLN